MDAKRKSMLIDEAEQKYAELIKELEFIKESDSEFFDTKGPNKQSIFSLENVQWAKDNVFFPADNSSFYPLYNLYDKEPVVLDMLCDIDKFCADNMTTDGDNSDSNYSALIMLARAQGNYEQALALIDEADEMYAMIPEFDRQKALIYLAQGDYDKAFDSAVSAEDRAYNRYYYYGDSTGYNSELLATVYLSAMLCRQKGQGKAENFSKLDEIIESYKGTDSEKAMADVLSGKVSLEKLLTEGVYDLI